MKKNLISLAAMALCLTALTACGGKESTAPVSTTELIETTEPVSTTAPESSTVQGELVEDETEVEYYSQDVYITNSTGVAILELYMSLAESDDWGSELLGEETFAAGETVLFEPELVGTAEDTWDIMVVDEDGDEIIFSNVSLSSATALDLHWGEDGATPTVSITGSDAESYYSQDLDITNGTGVTIMELYISLSNENNWGEDMLGEDVFQADETMHFSTELVGMDETTWDIKIVDEDGDEVVFEGINFSSAVGLVLNWGEDGATPTVTIN